MEKVANNLTEQKKLQELVRTYSGELLDIPIGSLVQYYWDNCVIPSAFRLFGCYGICLGRVTNNVTRTVDYALLIKGGVYAVDRACLKIIIPSNFSYERNSHIWTYEDILTMRYNWAKQS